MKKLLLLGLVGLLLTGCSEEDKVERKIQIDFNNEYYQVASPYKPSISGSYVVNNVLNNYNINDIENSYMMLSSNYFKTTNSLYQAGQYFSRNDLEKLLSSDNLNKEEKVKINGVEITPTYVSSLYEQNYLTNNGNLKGITIGIIINPYQAYLGDFGNYDYEEVPITTLEPIIIEKSKKVIEYIRTKPELKEVKVLVGVYLQNRPNALLPGGIKYVGITNDDSITLNKINYEYQYLNSNYVMTNDINIYNAFGNLEKQIKKIRDTINVSAKGLYQNNKLQNVEITVHSGTFNSGELLYLSNTISNEMENFDSQLTIQVVVKSNNSVLAFINKESNSLKSNVYILGG
ncbi:MAG: CamS family sex pheromone protein [Bacilli bacterium]|nr:CamS family sex pheromone protein [Bacilli bacterium]MDD4547229.1 CamS family sex pheromone protein [Bacilli bacterium]